MVLTLSAYGKRATGLCATGKPRVPHPLVASDPWFQVATLRHDDWAAKDFLLLLEAAPSRRDVTTSTHPGRRPSETRTRSRITDTAAGHGPKDRQTQTRKARKQARCRKGVRHVDRQEQKSSAGAASVEALRQLLRPAPEEEG